MNLRKIAAAVLSLSLICGAVPFSNVYMDNPVIFAEESADEYSLEDIKTNPDAFEYYANKLRKELYNGTWILTTMGNSSGYNECRFILALLNHNQGISNDVLSTVFDDYTAYDILNWSEFMSISYINYMCAEEPVDFRKYLFDRDLAEEINTMNEYFIQVSQGNSENFENQLSAFASHFSGWDSIDNYPLCWYYCGCGDLAWFEFGLDTRCISDSGRGFYRNGICENYFPFRIKKYENLYYEMSDEKASIIYFNTFASDVTIPLVIAGTSKMNITEHAFEYNYEISNLTIKNPVCEIFDSEDTIPEGVTIYGYNNSTAQAYAKKYNKKFISIGDCDNIMDLGDVDCDGVINSSDASITLVAYAKAATGGESPLIDIQVTAADVNKDGAVDSSDASSILAYYAYTATGGVGTLEEFLS